MTKQSLRRLIGARIETFRTGQKISQERFAQMCGVTRNTVYLWEKGNTEIGILALDAIARALSIGMVDLIFPDKLPEPRKQTIDDAISLILKKFKEQDETILSLKKKPAHQEQLQGIELPAQIADLLEILPFLDKADIKAIEALLEPARVRYCASKKSKHTVS